MTLILITLNSMQLKVLQTNDRFGKCRKQKDTNQITNPIKQLITHPS